MKALLHFLREWMLIVAILGGIAGYFIYTGLPFLDSTHGPVLEAVSVVQPLLIFVMLFLSFCQVSPRDIRPCRWHAWLLLVQAVMFTGIGCVLIAMPHSSLRVVLEGAMICLICPTATAAAVVTRKLGGSMPHITTYTILANLEASVLIPVMVPLVHPGHNMHVVSAMLLILGKVFPLLLLPLVLAILTRRLWPAALRLVNAVPDLAFYLWAVSLTLAIAVSTRSIMHSTVDLTAQLGLVVVSLAACAFQFWAGRKIGALYRDKVTAGQALGQKNTVFAIWLGYTFFSPVTAIAGGFYSIWHNVANSWQLYRHEKAKA